MMTPTERIMSLADRNCDPKQTGKGWSARCPCPEDRRPSLSVSEGEDGRALVMSFRGGTLGFDAELIGRLSRFTKLTQQKKQTAKCSYQIRGILTSFGNVIRAKLQKHSAHVGFGRVPKWDL